MKIRIPAYLRFENLSEFYRKHIHFEPFFSTTDLVRMTGWAHLFATFYRTINIFTFMIFLESVAL